MSAARRKRVVFALDVTSVSGLNFTTGVQRVVREYLRANRSAVELIQYDHKRDTWHVIPELPVLVTREREGAAAKMRMLAEKTSSTMVREVMRPGLKEFLRELPFARRGYEWWKHFNARHLQAQTLVKDYKLSEQPEWQPTPSTTYVMLDLPLRKEHAMAMEDLFRRPEVHSMVYLHDLFPLSHRHLFDRAGHQRARTLHLQYLDAVSRADCVAANSAFTLGQYRDFCRVLEESSFESQKTTIVHLPWPQLASAGTPDPAIADRMFGDAAVKVLLVGQLDTRKNFQVVVRAVKLLIERGVDVRLGILAGYSTLTDEALRDALESCSPDVRERITIEGVVTDAELLAIYDSANLVAVPSVAEGFGLPVIESLSRGKRVIAADATALSELGTLFGTDAVTIVDPFDPAKWARAIVDVAKRPTLPAVKVPKSIPKDWNDFHARLLAAAGR